MTRYNPRGIASELKSLFPTREAKYRRNARRYFDTPFLQLQNFRQEQQVGYFGGDWTYDNLNPNPNVIHSVIEALTSKLSQPKVRPIFTPINGGYEAIQATKNSQLFFDQYFANQKVDAKISKCFRNCAIFDRGVVYIDDETGSLRNILPYQVYYRPAEQTYFDDDLTVILFERKNFPVSKLPKKIRAKSNTFIRQEESSNVCVYGILYDTENHKKTYLVNGSEVLIKEYKPNVQPFLFLYYENPVLGSSSESVADLLNDTQLQINLIMQKIKEASLLTPANAIFINTNENLSVQHLDNKIGAVYKYGSQAPADSGSAGQSPVTVATPSFIDPQYPLLVETLTAQCYEMVGISMLSAQSKKPSGLDSGVALQTLEDITSERFETQLNQLITLRISIVKRCIELFPEDMQILPEKSTRAKITWGEMKEQSDNMNIQYSSADNLSKDPQTKMAQINQMLAMGIIQPHHASRLMELPDLESAYGIKNNAYNAVQAVIHRAMKESILVIPDAIPIPLLLEECLSLQLLLIATNASPADMYIIRRLYKMAIDKQGQASVENDIQTEKAIAQGEIDAIDKAIQNTSISGIQQPEDAWGGA